MKPATLGWIGAAVIAVGAAIAVHETQTAAPRLDFDTGCVQTTRAPNVGFAYPDVYTGKTGVFSFQWGFIAVEWGTTHVATWRNGIGKNMVPFCQPAINITGDCWSSVANFAASPGVEKWIITPNIADMCSGRSLQVWKKESGNWRFKAAIAANIKPLGGQPTLDGDFAYVIQNTGGQTPKYVKFDLNTLAVVATDLTTRPAFVPQAALPDGGKLQLYADFPTPLPQPWPGPRKYHVLFESVVTPTPTPLAADPLAAWDEQLAREGITAGCGNGNFCPNSPLTREQAAVWMLKLEHGSAYIPPPCTGMFNDVPCATPTPTP